MLGYDLYTHFLTTMVINGQMRSWFMVCDFIRPLTKYFAPKITLI